MNSLFHRLSVSAIALATILVGGPAHAQDTTASSGAKELTIASSLAYAPFEFVDASGAAAGLDIELARAVAKVLGVKLNIVTVPFAAQIPGLVSGRVKLAWSTFSITKERLAQVDFITFLQTSTVASSTPEKAGSFHGKNDLCGKQVAVQTGSGPDFVADKLNAECTSKGMPGLRKQLYPGQQETIQAVVTGRADLMLDDSTTSGYYEKTSNRKLVVLPGSYFPTPLGVAVAKGDKATASMVSGAIQKLIADGSYAAILAKYNMGTSAITHPEVFDNPAQVAQ